MSSGLDNRVSIVSESNFEWTRKFLSRFLSYSFNLWNYWDCFGLDGTGFDVNASDLSFELVKFGTESEDLVMDEFVFSEGSEDLFLFRIHFG